MKLMLRGNVKKVSDLLAEVLEDASKKKVCYSFMAVSKVNNKVYELWDWECTSCGSSGCKNPVVPIPEHFYQTRE